MQSAFADRDHAGRVLAGAVARLVPEDPLVLALPRGGVPVAAAVAAATGGVLDVLLTRKIGAPDHPEYGVGALAEDGPPVFDPAILSGLGLTAADLAGTVGRERAELARRTRRYRADRPAPDPSDRVVVVVDDGLATGVTARAALRWVRARSPRLLLLAVPVGATDSLRALADEADVVVCPRAEVDLGSVGAWYDDFTQLTDEDVERVLRGRPPED